MSSSNQCSYSYPNMFANISFISPTSLDKYTVFKLKKNIQSLPQASYSPILTIGAYIVCAHPYLQPPKCSCRQKTNGQVDLTYPNEALSVNYLLHPWCDYVSNLIIQKKCYQLDNQIYFLDFVDPAYIQNLVKSQIFEFSEIEKEKIQKYHKENDLVSVIQQVYKLEKIKVTKKRKMAAVCFSSKPSISDPHIPRVHIQGLFFGIFYRQQDQWTIYKPLQNIVPTEKELLQLDGIILSGSTHAVYENVPEINEFMQSLIAAYRKSQKLRILGLCFGHQSIAYHLGGKVQKMPVTITHLEDVKFNTQKLRKLNFEWVGVQKSLFLSQNQAYKISQFHGDAVTKIPEGFTVIGQSKSCPIQALVSNDGRILSYQFHMEYTPEFAKAYEFRLRSYNKKSEYGKIYEGSYKFESCERNRRSVEDLRKLSRRFLEGSRLDEKP